MDPNVTLSGSFSARQRNAIKLVFRCRYDDGRKLNAGLVVCFFFKGSASVLLGNPIHSWFFREEGVERDTSSRSVPDLKIVRVDLILDAMQSSHHLKSQNNALINVGVIDYI